VQAQVRNVIDAQQDPQAKSLLLAGDLNRAQCQNCGFVNEVTTPILYHDAENELLIAFVPMEVSQQSNQGDEKIIGDLMNQLTAMLPKDSFRSYMFNPKRALTLQGLTDQVLEADGITREMLDEQKARVDLLQSLLNQPHDQREAAIKAADAQIDMALIQTLSAMAQRVAQGGRSDVAQALAHLQEDIIAHSTFGQQLQQQQQQQGVVVQEVAQRVQQMGQNATRSDFADLAIEYADDEQRLQALIGLIRPAFDEQFFQEFNLRVSQAPSDEREKLETLRDTMQALTQVVDSQMQQGVQQAAQFLQAIVNAPNPDQFIQANIDMIDDTFMGVLSTNIQQAEQQGETQAAEALKGIYNQVVTALRSQMSPELQFINGLLSAADDDQMRQLLQQQIGNYDPNDLLQLLDSVERILSEQGQAEVLPRVQSIRAELEKSATS